MSRRILSSIALSFCAPPCMTRLLCCPVESCGGYSNSPPPHLFYLTNDSLPAPSDLSQKSPVNPPPCDLSGKGFFFHLPRLTSVHDACFVESLRDPPPLLNPCLSFYTVWMFTPVFFFNTWFRPRLCFIVVFHGSPTAEFFLR